MHQPPSNFSLVVQQGCLRTTSSLRCTSTWRDGSLSHLQRQVNHRRLLLPHNGFTTFTRSLAGAEEKDGAHILRKVEQIFFSFFFWTQALTKTLVGRRWLRSKASKFLASGPNQPRGPRRGGETSASFLNWSHRDPQGSPRRTRRKAIKIWPCGSDKELGGKKAEKKKDGFWGKKQREQTGRTVGGEEPVEADQGETWETRRVGLFSRVRLGKTVCQWGDRTGGGLVLSAIKPMLHVRWCAQPIQQACIFILPGSWQLTGWIISCWPEIRPWMRLVCLSTACWGPPRNKRYQSIPETPQPARHTAHLARPLQERTSTQWGYARVISQLFTAQYKAIIEGIIKGAKIIQKRRGRDQMWYANYLFVHY